MKVEDIIKKCNDNDIEIWSEGSELYFKFQEEPSDEFISILKKYKYDIIKYLEEQKRVKIDKDNLYNIFPLTDIQSAYLAGSNDDYYLGGVNCHTYLEFKVDCIDIKKFQLAWNKVIDKHDMLRAIINKEGNQRIKEKVKYPTLEVYDLRNLFEAELEKELNNIKETLSSKKYAYGDWPLHMFSISILNDYSIIHFSIDMIIADYISINLIFKDMNNYYRNTAKSDIEDTRVSFRDYVICSKNRNSILLRNIKKFNEDKKYWLDKIENIGSLPILPIKENINEERKFNRLKISLNKDKWDFIKKIASKNGITASTLILVAYVETLKRWSENKNFCINMTIMNRDDMFEKVVGDFTSVNILSIKNNEGTFMDKCKEIQSTVINDLEHKAFSGVDVLRELKRKKGEDIIIPYVFTSTLGADEVLAENKSHEDIFRNDNIIFGISQTPQVLIDCQVMEINGDLIIHWDYRLNQFKDNVIIDMFDSFSKVIDSFENYLFDENSVFNVPLPIKMQNSRGLLNDTKCVYENYMLYDGFLESLESKPDQIAIIHNNLEYSYYELGLYVSTIYEMFKTRNITKQDYIVILQYKGIWQIATALASILLGSRFIPVDKNQPDERIRKIIDKLGNPLIVSDYEVKNNYRNFINVNEVKVKKNISNFNIFDSEKKVDDIAYTIFTSGSTGEPKGVNITHKAVMNTILDVNKKMGIVEDDVFFMISKFSFDLSIYDVFGCFQVGAKVVIPSEEIDPIEYMNLINKYSITVWNSVPQIFKIFFNQVKSEVERKISLNSIKTVLLSGDKIPINMPKEVKQVFFNANVFSLGGATEGAIWSIFYDIKNYNFNKKIPYGLPLSNQRIYVLDNNGLICPNFVEGEIAIAGDGLAINYEDDEKLTAEKFVWNKYICDRLYLTGDIGYYNGDGILEICGRKDSQVKINGNRVELGEIESIISSIPFVKQNVVLVKEMNNNVKKIISFVVIEKNKEIIDNTDDRHFNLKLINDILHDEFEILDKDGLELWMKTANKVACIEILFNLRKVGIFIDFTEGYTLEEVHDHIHEKDEFKKTVNKMIDALLHHGYLVKVNSKYYLKEDKNIDLEKNRLWKKFYEIEKRVNYSKVFVEYFKESCYSILEQLKGEKNSLELFFPKGSTEVALSTYQNNAYNRILNVIVAKIVKNYLSVYQSPKAKFEILEIGAGVGGTTKYVIDNILDNNIKYHFTDISKYFLNNAKNEYNRFDFMEYSLLDINTDLKRTEFNSKFNIVISSNVLHNSKNISKTLSDVNSILADNGILIIIDATQELESLLVSLELKGGLSNFEDMRKDTDSFFYNTKQWIESIERADFTLMNIYPSDNDKLNCMGQSILIAMKNSKKEYNFNDMSSDIKNTVKEKLPKHMVVDEVIEIDSIPLNVNGKVDIKKLLQMHSVIEDNVENKNVIKPRSSIEMNIVKIWQKVLDKEDISIQDNFYVIGGDSLLIAQVVTEMKKNIPEISGFEWDQIMKLALENPTISSIAYKILENTNNSLLENNISNKDSYFNIYNSNPESDTIQAYFHAGTGRLIDYEGIFKHLLNLEEKIFNKNIIGFTFGNEKEYLSISEETLITDLAQKYAKKLMELNKDKYELIGYCIGGFIALETAKILKENGKNVSRIILISSHLCLHSINNQILIEYAYGNVINSDLSKIGIDNRNNRLQDALISLIKDKNSNITNKDLSGLSGEFEDLGLAFSKLSDLTHKERMELMYEYLNKKEFNGEKSTISMLNILYNIFEHSFKGMIYYKPNKYDLDVIVLNPSVKVSTFFPEIKSDVNWNEVITGNLIIHNIEGTHESCIDEEHIKNILPYLIRRW